MKSENVSAVPKFAGLVTVAFALAVTTIAGMFVMISALVESRYLTMVVAAFFVEFLGLGAIHLWERVIPLKYKKYVASNWKRPRRGY